MTEHFRILHVLRAPVGGLFRHVLDLSAAQAERGHDVGLVFDSTNTDPLSEARLAKVAGALSLGVTRMPMGRWPGLADASASRAVAALASAKGADVLHGHGAKGGAYARLAAKLVRFQGQSVAAFYTPHGGSLHFPPGTPAALAFIGMEKVLARFTDGLIFESDYIRHEYERRVGTGLAPTTVITNGLQPSDFGTHEPRADAADFLFVGELRQLKGVDVLLRALAEVKRARPVSAVIVGAGPDREAFERLGRGAAVDRRRDLSRAAPGSAGLPPWARHRGPVARRKPALRRAGGGRRPSAADRDRCRRHSGDRCRVRYAVAPSGRCRRRWLAPCKPFSTIPGRPRRVRRGCSRRCRSASLSVRRRLPCSTSTRRTGTSQIGPANLNDKPKRACSQPAGRWHDVCV